MAASLVLGNTYSLANYNWTCVELNSNYAVLLSSDGVTVGNFPGYIGTHRTMEGINISSYDTTMSTLYSNIQNLEYTSASFGSGLYLVSTDKINQSEIFESTSGQYASALVSAASNHETLGADHDYAWIGKYELDDDQEFAYAVQSNGRLSRWGSSANLVVAPAFNIDLSKIELNGSTIVVDSNVNAYQQKVLNETDTSYLLNKIAQTLNSQINSQVTPVATTSVFGKVRPDGTTIQINNNGVISLKTTPVTIATNSNNGLVKPDDNTVGVKSDGTLYIKVKPTPIPPDPDPTPTPIMTDPEDMIPYVHALTTDGSYVYAITLNKDKGQLGSNGFISSSDPWNEYSTNTFDIYTVTKNGFGNQIVRERSYFVPSQDKYQLKDKSWGTIVSYHIPESGYNTSGVPHQEGYYDSNYLMSSVGSSSYPSHLISYASTGGFDFITDMHNHETHKIYIGFSQNSQSKMKVYESDMLNWNYIGEYYQLSTDINKHIYHKPVIINSDIHYFEVSSHEHYVRKMSDVSSNYVTINDTVYDLSNNIINSFLIVKMGFYDNLIFSIGISSNTTNLCGIYKYNLTNQKWNLIAEMPDVFNGDYGNFQQINAVPNTNGSDIIDFVVCNDEIHCMRTDIQKKQLYYYVYDINSSEWINIGTCIPEIYYA